MQTDLLCSCIDVLQKAVHIVQTAFCVFLKSFPDRNLYLSSSLSVWVLWAIFSSFALILDVSILNVDCWGVFGFFVGLAILVDIAVPRVTQAWGTRGAGRSRVFCCRWRCRDACDSLYKDKMWKMFCDKLNKASLEGSRRLSKEGKKQVNQYRVRDTLLNCPFFLSVG